MPTESGDRHPRRPLPRLETRVFQGGIVVALPPFAALVGVLVIGTPTIVWAVPLALAVVVASVFLARWQQRRITYPLHTLSSLIEALRQGDYSLRAASGSLLGDMADDINRLAERLQAERLRFEESSYLLGKTLAALESAVLVFDRRRTLRLVNPVGEQLLDARSERLFGRTAGELGVAPLLDGAASQLQSLTFPGRSGRFEVRHAPLRRDGRGGQLLVINDVGRVLREEERQAWQRLLRVLGHEVNNSLAPIQSMAGTLAALVAREPLPADWRTDVAGGLDVVGKRAGALSRFLAGYARLARLPPPRMTRVDLSELLHKVAQLESRVPIALEGGEPACVSGDADQLEQALINLLRNAAEASAECGGSVRMRWRRERVRVVIEIEDDGPGPPKSDNLFVPFFTTKPGGSGIGLALVRQIAEAHGGEVGLADGEQGGTVARLWLPAITTAQTGSSRSESSVAAPSAPASPSP